MFHPEGPTLWELAVQALSSTDSGYDRLAPKFNLTPFCTPDDLLDRIAPYLGPARSAVRGVDLCTGTGAVLRVLRPVCQEEVVGVDRSAGMLDQAKQRDLPGTATVTLRQQDALALDDVDTYDVATCFGADGHILPPDQAAFAEAIFRALRPGGRYVCLTADKPPPTHPAWWMARGFNAVMHVRNAIVSPPFIMFYLLFTTERATEILTNAGFSVHIDRDVLPRPYRSLHVVTATKPL